MIINCIKCNKKFNVDNNLIPDQGRLLKCGKCGNEWFFKSENKIEVTKSENVKNKDKQINNLQLKEMIINEINDNTKSIESSKENEIKIHNKKKN